MTVVAQQSVLDAALAALTRTTGLSARVRPSAFNPSGEADIIVELNTAATRHSFTAQIKTADRFATPAMLKARADALPDPPFLVAPYVTRQVAERCRQLRLPFVDTAGNAYLEATGLFVYVVGQPRPAEFGHENFRALTPAGLKLIFALLCRPELLAANYRDIAAAAGVALGTVGAAIHDLETRGFLHARKMPDPERLIDEWVTHYAIALRPRLSLGRFRAEPGRLSQMALAPLNAFWGGEPAADRLTNYLKPAIFTIYTGEPAGRLIAAGRMRRDETGNVEILEKFWNFAADPEQTDRQTDVVPPLLAYADLLATNEARNAEAARMIYERRIAPTLAISR